MIRRSRPRNVAIGAAVFALLGLYACHEPELEGPGLVDPRVEIIAVRPADNMREAARD